MTISKLRELLNDVASNMRFVVKELMGTDYEGDAEEIACTDEPNRVIELARELIEKLEEDNEVGDEIWGAVFAVRALNTIMDNLKEIFK